MATLQRFKLLATRCAMPAASPSRSPAPGASSLAGVSSSGSPGIRLRRTRRTTLGRLLSRTTSSRRSGGGGKRAAPEAGDSGEGKALLRHSLRDLLVASPPSPAAGGGRVLVEEEEEVEVGLGAGAVRRFGGFDGFAAVRRGACSVRYGSRGLRYRLLRRTWRPVLVAIPE